MAAKSNGRAHVSSPDEVLRSIRAAREEVELGAEDGFSGPVTFLVYELNGDEHDQYTEALSEIRYRQEATPGQKDTGKLEVEIRPTPRRAKRLALWLSLRRDNGQRLFESDHQVGQLPARAQERLFAVADRLSKLTDDAQVAAGKDSATIPADAATSTSPSASD